MKDWLWLIVGLPAGGLVLVLANTFGIAFVGCRHPFRLGIQVHRLFTDSARYGDEVWFWTKADAEQDRLRRSYPGRFDHIPVIARGGKE